MNQTKKKNYIPFIIIFNLTEKSYFFEGYLYSKSSKTPTSFGFLNHFPAAVVKFLKTVIGWKDLGDSRALVTLESPNCGSNYYSSRTASPPWIGIGKIWKLLEIIGIFLENPGSDPSGKNFGFSRNSVSPLQILFERFQKTLMKEDENEEKKKKDNEQPELQTNKNLQDKVQKFFLLVKLIFIVGFCDIVTVVLFLTFLPFWQRLLLQFIFGVTLLLDGIDIPDTRNKQRQSKMTSNNDMDVDTSGTRRIAIKRKTPNDG
ncbi:hypothetical protein RFI_26774 [Reticulomyxa filosa]|uniref:Uncharacterized protein n=1 Tax=Reticulomyxa filosa TaxID=46433 RepID=X6M9N8_RETFI|nr:hypothetical protein RFI_26774 [Reticulomyxa filosa]|eukprot:ETO10604.1 hypothetical protein RFI_26774 [Reticulomyxa filosa]